MRRRKNPLFRLTGFFLIAVGALVLFARVLPAGLWWFCFGAGCVAGGIYLIKRK